MLVVCFKLKRHAFFCQNGCKTASKPHRAPPHPDLSLSMLGTRAHVWYAEGTQTCMEKVNMPQWYSKGGPAAGKTSCCISISSLVIFSAKTAMRLFPFLPLLLETEVVSQASKHACSAASGAFKVPLTSPQCTQRHKRKGQHMQTYHNWNYLSNSGIFAGQLIFFITSECWSLHALVVVGLCAWVAWQRQVLMRISSMVPEVHRCTLLLPYSAE